MKHFFLTLPLLGIFLMFAASQAIGEMVLYYSFDDVKGNTAEDLSEFGNNGTLENKPKTVDGETKKALEFESSRVKVLSSDKSLTSEIFREGMFTLVLWVNAKRAGNTWQQIFRAGPDPNDTLFINNDGRLSWRGWVGGGWAGGMCETDPGVVDEETWTHATVVGDKKNFRVYVDGELSKETDFQETRGNNGEYVIGGYGGGESYSGAVDEIAIFNEPLKEADINIIVDDGIQSYLAVHPQGKLATHWATLKVGF
jgi:hypothetical protein